MAFHNEIGTGRYNRFLQKLLQIKGPPPARQLATDIITVLNLFSGTENRYLENWNRFGRALLVAAVAGQNGKMQWRNPPGSNVVAVFEKITLAMTLTDSPTFSMGAGTTDLSAVDPNVQVLDPRGGVGIRPSIILSSQAAAGGGAGFAFGQFAFPANQSYDLISNENQEIALLPGQLLFAVSNVANQNLLISSMWRERALESSETQ